MPDLTDLSLLQYMIAQQLAGVDQAPPTPTDSPLAGLAARLGKGPAAGTTVKMSGNAKYRDRAGRADGDPHPTDPSMVWSNAKGHYVKRGAM